MKEELRVRYNVEAGIDAKLDHDLIACARMHGWHFWASGLDMDFEHQRAFGERDLAFDREEVAGSPE